MKKTLKNLFTISFTFVLLLGLAGCGEEKTNNGGSNSEGKQQGESSGVAWPSNQYTKLIPKPEGATIYDEKAIDNNYYVGHSIDLTDWTIEECKAYAEKLQEAGFTTPGSGLSSVIVTDTDSMYSFGAQNIDGVYVSVGSSNNTGRISIQVNIVE